MRRELLSSLVIWNTMFMMKLSSVMSPNHPLPQSMVDQEGHFRFSFSKNPFDPSDPRRRITGFTEVQLNPVKRRWIRRIITDVIY